MAVVVEGATIVLTGTVGADPFWWFEDGFDAASVIQALAEVGHDRDVTVRLNSGGGIATEGSAIHAALVAHKGRKTIVVEGIAASAAFTVAMAGDEIVVSPGAIMMMHDPSGVTVGTVADHEATVRSLNAIANSVAAVYAERSGDSVDKVRADMVAELWLTPDEAVSRGYADRVAGADPAQAGGGAEIIVPAAALEPAPYVYNRYQHAPERLTALMEARGWGQPRRPTQATPPVAQPRQETRMSNSPPGGGNADPNQNVVDLDAVRQEGHAAALAYVNEVNDICSLAGQPDRAAEFIQQNKSVADVRKVLLDERAGAGSGGGEITNHHAPGGRQAGPRPNLVADMKRRFGKS